MHERDVIERIFKRITELPSGCWMVDGWSDGKGYRNISIDGKTCKVHRVMFEWFWRRKLRKNVQVDHKCCNRSCCNPLHLQSCMNKKNSKLRDKRKKKMAYGDYSGPDKPDKGKEGGSCNRRLCQASPANHYNHGSLSWYCEDCKRDIGEDTFNKRDWEQNMQPKYGHPMFETREEMNERQKARS